MTRVHLNNLILVHIVIAHTIIQLIINITIIGMIIIIHLPLFTVEGRTVQWFYQLHIT